MEMHKKDWNGDEMDHSTCCGHKKEFKLAMLDKKEKILQIKLDFIKKMKEMMKKEDM